MSSLTICGDKLGKCVLVLLTGVFLAAGGLLATENSPADGTHKTAANSAVGTAHHPAPPARGDKRGAPTASISSTHNRNLGSPRSLERNAAAKNSPRGATASAAARGQNRSNAYASQHHASPGHKRYAKASAPRVLTGQQRLSRLHLQPERVDEIQLALIREGYLQGDPTGEWDAHTRDAMLRYQTMHGFPATGLPEAKSLMKLGLGSHPLPPELDHGAVGIANPVATQNVFSVSPLSPPISQSPAPDSGTPQTSP